MFYETILDSDINYSNETLKKENLRLRLGARGIILNKDNPNLIGIFFKRNMNEYKLPGGGLEADEVPTTAFRREILEETGCAIENITPIGVTTEIKSKNGFIQTSFVFVANQVGIQHNLNMTEKEILEGGSFLWLDINEAIDKMEHSFENLKASFDETVYSTSFIVKRDILILKNYLKILNK